MLKTTHEDRAFAVFSFCLLQRLRLLRNSPPNTVLADGGEVAQHLI